MKNIYSIEIEIDNKGTKKEAEINFKKGTIRFKDKNIVVYTFDKGYVESIEDQLLNILEDEAESFMRKMWNKGL